MIAAQVRQAVDRQPAQAVAADQHVLAAQTMGGGKGGHVLEQRSKGFPDIVLRIVLGAECRQQIIDRVADEVADQRLTRTAGATKGDADFRELSLGIVFSENLDLGGGVTDFLAEKGAAPVDLAVVAQLRGGDRCPAGLLHRLQRSFFRIGVPGNTGDRPLRIRAADQRRDQRGRQPEAESVVLIAGGKTVIEVVIGIQRDRHRVAEQRLGF
ncbi:hypothetical protein D3C78_1075220 [compost metagenome]